jgi:hypothetical protein
MSGVNFSMAKMNAEKARREERRVMGQMILDWCQDMEDYASIEEVSKLLGYRDAHYKGEDNGI